MNDGACTPFEYSKIIKLSEVERLKIYCSWLLTSPSIALSVIEGIDIKKNYEEDLILYVRKNIQKTNNWKSIYKNYHKLDEKSKEFIEFRCQYAKFINDYFVSKFGVRIDVFWKVPKTLGAPTKAEFLNMVWLPQKNDNLPFVANIILDPLTVAADLFDFYIRHKLIIKSTVARIEELTIYGKRNTNEIVDGLNSLLKRKWNRKPNIGEVVLHLYDLDKSNAIQNMSGYEFEKLCENIIRKSGYEARITSNSSDNGVDIIAQTELYLIAIQCKYLNKPAGIKSVQEIVSGMRHYMADYGMVICNNGFTRAAEDLAETNGIILGNENTLSRLQDLF